MSEISTEDVEKVIQYLRNAKKPNGQLNDEIALLVGWRVRMPENCRVMAQDGDCYGCGNKPPKEGCKVPRSLWNWWGPEGENGARPNYTGSLSVAITIVPLGFQWLVRSDEERGGFANVTHPYWVPKFEIFFDETMSEAEQRLSQEEPEIEPNQAYPSYGATPEIALCISALEALKELVKQ